MLAAYLGQNIVPKSGNVFDGQGLAILDGTNVTPRAFGGSASNVTIKNMTIQNYRPPQSQFSAVGVLEFGNAWRIENNTIQTSFYIGLNLGNNNVVVGNKLINNGQAGLPVAAADGW